MWIAALIAAVVLGYVALHPKVGPKVTPYTICDQQTSTACKPPEKEHDLE